MVFQLARTPYKSPPLPVVQGELPPVCIQVPLYNEAPVARRVIESVCKIEYPAELLEIQILDDSTDETRAIVDDAVLRLQNQGVPVRVIRRSSRTEYKAGALRHGISLSRARFFAVFDADFLPPVDFLLRTVPYFQEERVAFVQARWGHLNREASFLTRAQAILIDGHFLIEHAARAQHGFFNFNGTAGVWRREAIDDAGGWQGDTVTEDLDLSYRAFLAGWQAVYVPELVCQSELPGTIAAFKSQQFRWMKGAAQVARKLLPAIIGASWTWRQKAEAFFHLTANFCYILMVIAAVLLVPVAFIRADLYFSIGLWFELGIFFFTLVSLVTFYCFAQKLQGRRIVTLDVLSGIILGVGIAAHCARASLAGLSSWSGEFVRTPKSGAIVKRSAAVDRSFFIRDIFYHKKELCMALYLAFGLVYLAVHYLWFTIPFVLLIFSGYASVLYSAIRSGR